MSEVTRPMSADRLDAVQNFCRALGFDPGNVTEIHIDTRAISITHRHPADRRFETTDVLDIR